MNNAYGWAMSGYLPNGGFKWLKNVDGFDVDSGSEKSPIGYILKVDHTMYYTMIIHQLQKNLQFLMTYRQINVKKFAGKYGRKVSDAKN